MSTPSLQDLGARAIAIAQAMASGATPDMDQLHDLLLGEVGEARDLVDKTAAQIKAAAEDLLARAKERAEALMAMKDAAVAQAEARLAEATSRLEEERDRAIAAAERAKQAAESGLQQARATGDHAVDEAERTRDAAVAEADQAQRDAENAFMQAVENARGRVDAAKQVAERMLAEATQAVTAAQDQVNGAVAAAQEIVDRVAGLAQQLPADVVALGEDALARLEGALEWPSGTLSLLAQALVWMKKRYFAGVHQLQVIWQEPPDGPGLGLLWLDGPEMVRIVYRPTPAPGTLLVETKGDDSVTFTSGPDISVTITGKADQPLLIGKGVAPPDGGPDTAKMQVVFGALAFEEPLGPLTAVLQMPTLSVELRHAGTWGYKVKLEVPTYGASLGLSGFLAQAGVPLPVALPEVEEVRSLTVEVADGRFSLLEGASA